MLFSDNSQVCISQGSENVSLGSFPLRFPRDYLLSFEYWIKQAHFPVFTDYFVKESFTTQPGKKKKKIQGGGITKIVLGIYHLWDYMYNFQIKEICPCSQEFVISCSPCWLSAVMHSLALLVFNSPQIGIQRINVFEKIGQICTTKLNQKNLLHNTQAYTQNRLNT